MNALLVRTIVSHLNMHEVSEMQKAADKADISVLFFQGVVILGPCMKTGNGTRIVTVAH